ncbi:MAG: hypothetical protein ACOC5F_04235 [Candidatus Aminicenantaceae bacterium]
MKNFHHIKHVFALLIILLFISCTGSQITQKVGFIQPSLTFGMAPSGGELADAIERKLIEKGYKVMDRPTLSDIMAEHNLTEKDFSNTDNLEILRNECIDAIITVDATTGYDGEPNDAIVTVKRTNSRGDILASILWENGEG